ncbi:hypothetical protein FACS1894184_21020 [Clostridia bacterium]|nr:hypothetical protein FACS1894184_21020 [Clostridia bacterium]
MNGLVDCVKRFVTGEEEDFLFNISYDMYFNHDFDKLSKSTREIFLETINFAVDDYREDNENSSLDNETYRALIGKYYNKFAEWSGYAKPVKDLPEVDEFDDFEPTIDQVEGLKQYPKPMIVKR